MKTWLYTWVALSSIVQNFADGYVWFPLGFVSVWCILENFFVFFKCWLLLIVAAYINKLINTKTVPWLEQMKPHIFWFFQATKPIECMRNEIGERDLPSARGTAAYEISSEEPLSDFLLPKCRPLDFFLLCWNKMEVEFYISRCFSLTMFIFYMYNFSTVFTFIFIVTVLWWT